MANNNRQERRAQLHQDFKVAQRERAVRAGNALFHDGVYVTQQDVSELNECGLRLTQEGEQGELVYLDDVRCVTVCPTNSQMSLDFEGSANLAAAPSESLTPAQIVVAAEDKPRVLAQSPVLSTTPQPLRVAAPAPARP